MSHITAEVGCRVILTELSNTPSRMPSRILDLVKEKGDLEKAQIGLDVPLGRALHKRKENEVFTFSCEGRPRVFRVDKIIGHDSMAPAGGGPRNKRVVRAARKEVLASYRDVLA